MNTVLRIAKLMVNITAWGSVVALIWGVLLGWFSEADWWQLGSALVIFALMAAATSEFETEKSDKGKGAK